MIENSNNYDVERLDGWTDHSIPLTSEGAHELEEITARNELEAQAALNDYYHSLRLRELTVGKTVELTTKLPVEEKKSEKKSVAEE